MEHKITSKKIIRSRREGYLLSAVILIPAVLMWFVFVQKSRGLDETILQGIAPYIRSGRTAFMKGVTFLGNHKFLVPANLLLIGLLLFRKEKAMALTVFIVAISSLLLKLGLKELFQRPRPADPLVDGITNYSFPSGHALMSIAFYGLLIWMAGQYIKNRSLRNGLIIFLVLLIGLIGFSRIYLRVHYPSDVIAGYCIGILWLWCCLRVTSRIRPVPTAYKESGARSPSP